MFLKALTDKKSGLALVFCKFCSAEYVPIFMPRALVANKNEKMAKIEAQNG
jgi:hypothetical protein